MPAPPLLRRFDAVLGERTRSSDLLRREALYKRLLGASDVLAAGLTLLVVLNLLGDDRATALSLVALPLVVLGFKLVGLYDRDALVIRPSTLEDAPRLFLLSGLFSYLVFLLEPVVLQGDLGQGQALGLWFGAFASTLVGRRVARGVAGRIAPVERCLVFGDLAHTAQLREKLHASRAKARIVATVTLARDDIATIGGPEELRRIVDEHDIHRVLIAPVSTNAAAMSHLIRVAKAVGVRVSVLPRIFEAVGSAVEFDELDGMTILGVRRFGLTNSSRLLKRSFDLVGASLGLLAVAPFMAAIAVAIKLDSPGPVFFRQTRVGREGQRFGMIKFRSMIPEAEAMKDALRDLNEASGLFKIAEDPRVTRVGRFLRRTSLDELPQLFNVLRGEMSLVGPRPLVIDEDAQVSGLDRSRLHLTPGMTGPWQILGSTRVPIEEMVGMDYLYVANWTLWTDIKLLVRTVFHVFGRHGL